jgi:hypothetical protein
MAFVVRSAEALETFTRTTSSPMRRIGGSGSKSRMVAPFALIATVPPTAISRFIGAAGSASVAGSPAVEKTAKVGRAVDPAA